MRGSFPFSGKKERYFSFHLAQKEKNRYIDLMKAIKLSKEGRKKMKQKTLQVKLNGAWEMVFARNTSGSIITTTDSKKALKGEDAKQYFERCFANHEFKLA